jgi:hypothetical protein
VEGWIVTGDPGELDVAIAADAGGTPGTDLFSGSVDVAGFLDASWLGVTGENWNLGPGNYWAVFTTPVDGGYMPSPVPNPLDNYAYSYTILNNDPWVNQDLDIGIQIGSAVSSVPDAANTALLLLLGGSLLIAAGAVSRRRAV